MYNKFMNDELELKLKTLPISPGVYFHKDKTGEIIYVGKAAILRNRVKQYFQSSRTMDVKTLALVAEITDIDWVETESEIDALFLEAEMVKRYMPRYNILLRDDRSLIYVRIDMKSDWPYVSFTRNPADDEAEYFGPYYNGFAVKKAMRYLRRVFPYYVKTPKENTKPDLDAHLGLAPVNMTSDEYKANLRKLVSYIKGNRKTIVADLEREMKLAAKSQNFELAALNRNKLHNLRELQRRIMFGDKEFLDISKDEALSDLTDLLGLAKIPVRIEGYDISHMSGAQVVASMVVFKNGASDRSQYRKFKTRIEQNDDFFNMNETITRRFSSRNIKNWGKPDLVLIDGGKGQLDAALQARDKSEHRGIPFIGLAKRDEQIVVKDIQVNRQKLSEIKGSIESTAGFVLINIPKSSNVIKLLQRIRDESHRFAVSYHTTLQRTKQTASSLEEIPGIGPKTRSKLIRRFGSLRGLKAADESEVIATIGQGKAKLVLWYVKAL
jgi:excinuclease ABC subunit C